MVTNVTSMSRSGLSDWLLQRLSAVIIAAYTIWLVAVFFCYPEMTFDQWSALFATWWVKLFTLVALFSIAAHAWIGLWTIGTDYLKHTMVRLLFQWLCIFLLFAYAVWGIQILWNV